MRRTNQIASTRSQEIIVTQPNAATAIAEAIQRPVSHGLVVDRPTADPEYDPLARRDVLQLTRLGREVQREPMAAEIVRSRRRLELDLHSRLPPSLS